MILQLYNISARGLKWARECITAAAARRVRLTRPGALTIIYRRFVSEAFGMRKFMKSFAAAAAFVTILAGAARADVTVRAPSEV